MSIFYPKMTASLVFCLTHRYGWVVKKRVGGHLVKSFCDKQALDIKPCNIQFVAYLKKNNRQGKVKEKIFVEGLHLTYAYKMLFDTVIVDKKGNEIELPWVTNYLRCSS